MLVHQRVHPFHRDVNQQMSFTEGVVGLAGRPLASPIWDVTAIPMEHFLRFLVNPPRDVSLRNFHFCWYNITWLVVFRHPSEK